MLKKKLVHHLIALVSFFLVAIIFCKPVLEGKILMASDNFQTIGSLKEADDNIKNTKEVVSGWTGYMFSGMPLYRQHDPNKLVKIVYMLQQGAHAHSYDLLFWLMLSFYLFCIAVEINIWVAMFVSIAFAFTGFNIMSMQHGHFLKIFAFAMIPGTLGGMIFLLRDKLLVGAIVFIFFLNLLIGINHTQVTFYAVMLALITFLFFGYKAVKEKGIPNLWKAGGIMTIALVLGIITNIGVFYNSILAEATTRGGSSELSNKKEFGSGLEKDYASAWSMDRMETFTYFLPNFAGGPSGVSFLNDKESATYAAFRKNQNEDVNSLLQQTKTYWGSQPGVGGGFYMGAGLCFLFILYLIFAKDFKRYWLLASFVFILCFALGKNFPIFYNFVFNHLPLYNKFRVPSMMNLLMQSIIAIGAALAIQKILAKQVDKIMVTKALIGTFAGFALFVVLAPMFFDFASKDGTSESLPGWLQTALRKDRIALVHQDAIRSLTIMALCGGLIWLFVQNKIKNQFVFIVAIGAIISIDVIGNASNYIKWDGKPSDTFAYFQSKKKLFQIFNLTDADKQIKQDPDIHYRVFNQTRSPFNDAVTCYNHKSIGGYHGAKLRRYQELIEYHLGKGNMAVFNMLNAKYFISQDKNNQPIAQRNPAAAGHAWFVDSLKVVTNGDDEINALNPPFDPKKYAVIQSSYLKNASATYPIAERTIELTSYAPDKMTYKSKASADGFAVFSEVYYLISNGSGWHAFIDGKEQDVKKVDYLLRGLNVPAGEHDIVFEFNKKQVVKIYRIRSISSILTGLLLVALIGFGLWKSKDDKIELKKS